MATALQEIGYADALLARELPDGTLELIDGHLRAETTPDDSVPVLILDVDEAEAKALLATLDPLAALAESDQAELDSLLAEIESETATLLHAPEADDAAEVEEIHLRPPAEVAWVLLAIPIERFADASAPLSQLESLADLTVQVSRGKEGG